MIILFQYPPFVLKFHFSIHFTSSNQNAEKARVTGADEQKLRAELEKLNKETSTFSGSGYSLSGPSPAAAAQPAAVKPAAAPVATSAPAAPRRNPWADPNVLFSFDHHGFLTSR
jgi:hypothetical protein